MTNSVSVSFFHQRFQVQHGMDPLVNIQKSVFLPLWDNYELYGHKVLHIESFLAIESQNLEFENSSYERSTHERMEYASSGTDAPLNANRKWKRLQYHMHP